MHLDENASVKPPHQDIDLQILDDGLGKLPKLDLNFFALLFSLALLMTMPRVRLVKRQDGSPVAQRHLRFQHPLLRAPPR